MKSIQYTIFYAILVLSLLLGSCRKDNGASPDGQNISGSRRGLYVLCEGSFNGNNSTLAYYDYASQVTVQDQFFSMNSRGLGDTGNDAQQYGAKLYVVVDVSSTVEVTDAKTARSLKRVEFKDGTRARQPRYIVFNKNKAYVSSFDGTVAVMDTATLAVEKYIPVGRNPEKMAIANGKLYVANSGGLDYPNYDNTVSVIDLATQTEIKKITVTLNPRGVAADQYGSVYVLSAGDYAAAGPAMAIISSQTDLVTKTFSDFSAGAMTISGDYAYLAGVNYDAQFNAQAFVKKFNVRTGLVEKENFITDGTVITTPYGISADPHTGEVFVTDAKNYATNGQVYCFDSKGVKKYVLHVGINPNSVVLISN